MSRSEFTNYYEVSLSRVLPAATARIKMIDEELLPLAYECLEREKQDASQRLFRKLAFGWNWHTFYRWVTNRGDLMLYCMDHPEEILDWLEGWKCDNAIGVLENVRGKIATIQMNCERDAGQKVAGNMLMKQSDHSWLFAPDPIKNIKANLEPWLTQIETERGDEE